MFNFFIGQKVLEEMHIDGVAHTYATGEREESGLKRMLRTFNERREERQQAKRAMSDIFPDQAEQQKKGRAWAEERQASFFDRIVEKANVVLSLANSPAGVLNVILQDVHSSPTARYYPGVETRRVEKAKAIEYWDAKDKKREAPLFVDKGKAVAVSPPTTSKSVEAALRHAATRNDKPLRVQGSEAFIKQTIQAALGLGVADRLVGVPDKLLEAGREQYLRDNQKSKVMPDARPTRVMKDRQQAPRIIVQAGAQLAPPQNSAQAADRDAGEYMQAHSLARKGGPKVWADFNKKSEELTQRLGARKELVKNNMASLSATRDASMIQTTALADPRFRLLAQLAANEQHLVAQETGYKEALAQAETHQERFDLQQKADDATSRLQQATEAKEKWISNGYPADPLNARLTREAAGMGHAENQIMCNADEQHHRRDREEGRDWSSGRSTSLVRDDIQSEFKAAKEKDELALAAERQVEHKHGIELGFG